MSVTPLRPSPGPAPEPDAIRPGIRRLRAPRGLLVGILLTAAACTAGEPAEEGGPRLLADPCDSCRVTLAPDPVAVLGTPEDPASTNSSAPLQSCGVGALPDGRFISAGLVGGGQLAVYDPRSGGVSELVGRPGEGPGEFGRAVHLLPDDDPESTLVVDVLNQRVSRLDSTLALAGMWSLPIRPVAQAYTGNGVFVLHQWNLTGQDPRFVGVDSTGTTTFTSHEGDPGVVVAPDSPGLDQWIVTSNTGPGFLAANVWHYRITRFDGEGRAVERFFREVAWMPAPELREGFRDGMHTERPAPPVLTHMRVDGAGRLWTFVVLPDTEWSAGPYDGPDPGPAWMRRTFDTVVEVVDLEAAAVLASGRFDEVVAPVCDAELLYTVRASTDGDTRIAILEPRIPGVR